MSNEWEHDQEPRIDPDDKWREHLTQQDLDEWKQELDAMRSDPSISRADKYVKSQEIEDHYFKRAVKSQGFKWFEVTAQLTFRLVAKSGDEGQARACEMVNGAEIEMKLQEI